MFRLIGLLVAMGLLVGLLVRGGAVTLPVTGSGGIGPVRGWLLGEELPRLEQRTARLEAGREAMEREMADRLSALSDRLQSLESAAGAQRLEHGAVSARQDDREWHLANLFTRSREFRQRVVFSRPFDQPPRVMMGIVMLDYNQEKIRFQASPVEIDALGFTALLETRAEERPREVRVEWLAFGR